MFLGSFEPSFDLNSRRIALPKKIRESLATGEVILSFGFEKCIFGFDIQSWQKETKKQLDLPLFEKRQRDNRRFFFAAATFIKLDHQGRIVIPNSHLEYAQITKPVVIGAGDHFEIWEEKSWRMELSKIEREQE
jgi:MraZ protein